MNLKSIKSTNITIISLTIIVMYSLCVLIISGCNRHHTSNQQITKLTSATDLSLADASVYLLEIAVNNIPAASDDQTTVTNEQPTTTNTNTQNSTYSSKYYIVVYIGSQSTVVYGKDENGEYTKIIQCFTCSTGKGSTPTRTGVYKVRAKYRWRLLVGNVYGQYSSSISSNYLFHSVPYNKMDVSTLDNSEYDKLGSPASHGCIRMCVRDSKWIYDNVPIGTKVDIVKESGPAGWSIPKRIDESIYNGWDPSDKWASGNPYFTTPSSTTSTIATTSTTEFSTEDPKITTSPTETSQTTISSENVTDNGQLKTIGNFIVT